MLAQGAGVALEDAFILARRLRDYNDFQERLCLPDASRARSGVKGGGLEEVLARYDEERLRRSAGNPAVVLSCSHGIIVYTENIRISFWVRITIL